MTTADPPIGPAAVKRTPAPQKARQLAKQLRAERPDYIYLKEVFRHLRAELDVEVQRQPKKLPYVPTEDEIRRYYETVWKQRRGGDIVLIKTLLYTGVRVAELVAIRIDDVDLDACRIRITNGKGGKDRYVPFPAAFKETLALHMAAMRDKGAALGLPPFGGHSTCQDVPGEGSPSWGNSAGGFRRSSSVMRWSWFGLRVGRSPMWPGSWGVVRRV